MLGESDMVEPVESFETYDGRRSPYLFSLLHDITPNPSGRALLAREGYDINEQEDVEMKMMKQARPFHSNLVFERFCYSSSLSTKAETVLS